MSSPNYTLSTNVPQSAQKISATQAPIASNFQAINEWINVNHVGFNDPINYGAHNFTSFEIQGSDPATSSTQMALYSKAVTGGSNPSEIFYRYPSSGTVVQLSGGGGTVDAITNGYSYIGSMIMQWGESTITTGSNTIAFNISFTSTVYLVQFTPASTYTITVAGAYIPSKTLTNFVLTAPSPYCTNVFWMALGV